MTPEARYSMLQSLRTAERKHADAVIEAKDTLVQDVVSIVEAHLGKQTLVPVQSTDMPKVEA